MSKLKFLYILLNSLILCAVGSGSKVRSQTGNSTSDTLKADKNFVLESSVLGYFSPNGTRNPTLKAKKGERVKITIINRELMPHDVAMEKGRQKSKTIVEKGDSASIMFTAKENDIYYCTVPGHRLAGMEGKFEISNNEANAKQPVAFQPALNGKKLNLDFEKGDLTDWTANGEAFKEPVISEDPSPLLGKEVKVGKAGKYFVSSGGVANYKLTGTLTSVAFPVSHPFASFHVSGGALADTRVEILGPEEKVLFSITGSGQEVLQPVVVDLTKHLGENIKVRIIDNETGISIIPYIKDDERAHINFDNFVFYGSRPYFDNELKSEDIIALPPLDSIKFAGLSGPEAAKSMAAPDGFKVTLAASEPDIIRPISFTIDARNRLWVVEGHTYPVKAPEGQGRDRILIFEDTDGDGTLDKRNVFMEGLNLVSGIEVGLGGVWIGAAPQLLYIPIDYKNDKPAGAPQVLLDGWGLDDTHETLNNLKWGPDGWLYGVQGIFTQSLVGKPGAPETERVKLNACVWRYHPTRKEFEVFSEGTSNPWGIDFNDYGHAFITACVVPHLYHAIQGARYQRQGGGDHFNPYTFEDIKTIADHVHWVGDRGPHAGNFRSASKGGGHAHAGAMVYLGGSWPKDYRNIIFMNNINGARLNNDLLEKKGSGYVGRHRPDFIEMNDSWSQWLNTKYDAGGSVFAIDWYDKNQCHSPNPDVHDKTLGRIFKITYKDDKWKKVDLYQASNKELIEYHLNPNDWYVRQARLILQERGISKAEQKLLREMLETNPEVTRKLRALWTLHVTDSLTEEDLLKLTSHGDENIRSWAIQFLNEKHLSSQRVKNRLNALAGEKTTPLERLYLLSALQRFPANERWEMLESLIQKPEDAKDQNLPLMLWYALEPAIETDPGKAIELAMKATPTSILLFTVRRIQALGTPESKEVLLGLRKRLEKERNHNYHESLELLKPSADSTKAHH